jgi:hypothetical protein
MTEYNDKQDRISATMWFSANQALHELDDISFAVGAIVATCTHPGSNEREMASNAALGIRRRIDYLHDSFRRLLEGKR